MKVSLRFLVAAACLVLLGASVAGADDGSIAIIRDKLGRIVAAVPRDNDNVKLVSETVVIVPFYNRKVSKHPALFVNAQLTFQSDRDGPVLMGFPEMLGVSKRAYLDGEDDAKWRRKTKLLKRPTIAAFAAFAGGQPIAVKSVPGKKPYRRWFSFTVPMKRGQPVTIKNLYVAYAGSRVRTESSGCDEGYLADYVLHTGGTWKGRIGKGTIEVRAGRRNLKRRFSKLKPKRKDDISLPIQVVHDPTPDTGCGTLNKRRILYTTSARKGKQLRHYSGMLLDRDPSTVWIDEGEKGAMGQQINLPTMSKHKSGRVKGLTVQSGSPASGIARPKAIDVSCIPNHCRIVDHENYTQSCDGKPRKLGSFVLADHSQPQTFRFRRSRKCGAVRIKIKSTHGAAGQHATIGELDVIY